jgi:hypothetical protein
MRQKYFLSKEGSANNLMIREYAATGKDKRTIQGALSPEEDYTFLYQESYEGEVIRISITDDILVLIECLRTNTFFPVGRLAARIAASVIELYRLPGDRSIELFFDDAELFSHD